MNRNSWILSLFTPFILFVSCQPNQSKLKDVSPYTPDKKCKWVIEGGIGQFKKASTHPGFPAKHNPHLTISRRGLTLRVVGTLTDETIDKHGSLEQLVENYPYVVPIYQTSHHIARPEDLSVHENVRSQTPKGEVLQTFVTEVPENTVMIVYPIAIADVSQRFNTAAGNHHLVKKTRFKSTNKFGHFGGFPFLMYTYRGHAFHGPEEQSVNPEFWHLRRGEVSHGCQRMQGEHVLELASLLGCSPDTSRRKCPDPTNEIDDFEYVTVIEEFDIIPRPQRVVNLGEVTSWEEVRDNWVAVGLKDYPREEPIPSNWVIPDKVDTWLYLNKTENRTWSILPSPLGSASTNIEQRFQGRVSLQLFPTWENDVNSFPRVYAKNCPSNNM